MVEEEEEGGEEAPIPLVLTERNLYVALKFGSEPFGEGDIPAVYFSPNLSYILCSNGVY